MAYYLTKIERIKTSKEVFNKICETIKTESVKYKLCSLKTTIHNTDYGYDFEYGNYNKSYTLTYTLEFVTEKELSFEEKLMLSRLNLYQGKRTFKKISNLRYKLFYKM